MAVPWYPCTHTAAACTKFSMRPSGDLKTHTKFSTRVLNLVHAQEAWSQELIGELPPFLVPAQVPTSSYYYKLVQKGSEGGVLPSINGSNIHEPTNRLVSRCKHITNFCLCEVTLLCGYCVFLEYPQGTNTCTTTQVDTMYIYSVLKKVPECQD